MKLAFLTLNYRSNLFKMLSPKPKDSKQNILIMNFGPIGLGSVLSLKLSLYESSYELNCRSDPAIMTIHILQNCYDHYICMGPMSYYGEDCLIYCF